MSRREVSKDTRTIRSEGGEQRKARELVAAHTPELSAMAKVRA